MFFIFLFGKQGFFFSSLFSGQDRPPPDWLAQDRPSPDRSSAGPPKISLLFFSLSGGPHLQLKPPQKKRKNEKHEEKKKTARGGGGRSQTQTVTSLGRRRRGRENCSTQTSLLLPPNQWSAAAWSIEGVQTARILSAVEAKILRALLPNTSWKRCGLCFLFW